MHSCGQLGVFSARTRRLQRAHGNVLRLIYEPLEHRDGVLDLQPPALPASTLHHSLELFANDHELAPHRRFRPAESSTLSTVPLGDEALNLGRVREQRRRLPAAFFDDYERGRDISEKGRDMIGELGVLQTRRDAQTLVATNT